MTSVLDALEEHGLIERRVDRKDRRVRHVVPTDEGRELLYRARATMADVEQDLRGELSATQWTELRRLLAQVALGVDRPGSC